MCFGLPVILADTPALRATAGRYPADFLDDPLVPAIAERLRAFATAGTAPDLSAAAKAARARFSAERFDREMMDLLDADKT
jgi:glycosyltransferase involved in cell wall biosynthesis